MTTRSKRETKVPTRLINEDVKPVAKRATKPKKVVVKVTPKKATKKATKPATTKKPATKTAPKKTTAKKAKDTKAAKAKTEVKRAEKKTPVSKKADKTEKADKTTTTKPAKTVAPKRAASPKKAAAKKTPKIKSVRPYELLSEAQKTELDKLIISQLKDRLRANNQIVSGTRPVLIDRIADCIINGCLPTCPTCFGGRLKYEGGIYTCPGFHDGDDFKRCSYKTSSVTRPAWTVESGKAI